MLPTKSLARFDDNLVAKAVDFQNLVRRQTMEGRHSKVASFRRGLKPRTRPITSFLGCSPRTPLVI